MKKAILLDPAFRRMENIFSEADLTRLNEVADVRWARDEPIPDAELNAQKDDVVAVVTGAWRYGSVERFPKLQAILEVGGGFPPADVLDYEACFSRSIRVLSCSTAFGPAVAEMGLGLALACTRQIAYTDRAFRSHEPQWSHTEFATEIGDTFTLYGKRVGFIGFGGLAHCLQPLLEPFGCPIQVYDPWLTDTYLRDSGVTPVGIETLLSTSRIIFVLAVPSDSNRAFLDRAKLELIRPDSVFILLSRAHVTDFEALTELVRLGKFRAGIDVYPNEPLAPDHPIRSAEHAVLSSHRAGAIDEGIRNIGRVVTNDIEAICNGLVPTYMQEARPEFIRMRGI